MIIYEKISHVFMQVFVANPNKPREVKIILSKNQEKLLELLRDLSPGKGYRTFSSELLWKLYILHI